MSSRFSRPKKNVSQNKPQIGYSKPVDNQKKTYKYHCIVTGDKRAFPCGGCINPKGCLSNSMQYKEME